MLYRYYSYTIYCSLYTRYTNRSYARKHNLGKQLLGVKMSSVFVSYKLESLSFILSNTTGIWIGIIISYTIFIQVSRQFTTIQWIYSTLLFNIFNCKKVNDRWSIWFHQRRERGEIKPYTFYRKNRLNLTL